MYTGPPTGGENYSIMDCAMVTERSTGKWRCSNVESAPNCPRCASSNTKFCYYNNYSLSQPRYFCKGCRRYWTKGGSLRNVPVGGGCRRSRRARATRQGGATNYPSPTRLSHKNESGATTDIDLAAVFAKYVSQNIRENEESCSPGGSSGSSDDIQKGLSEIDGQYLDNVAMFQYQKPMDLMNGGDDQDQLQQMTPEISTSTVDGENNGPDFVYQDCNAFDLQQSILGDDLGLLWSDDNINLPNFAWQRQTAMQVEDLGNFSDQFRLSENLAGENWGLLDLSAYEYFPRP